jgi:ADP-L-glycero-D-manno-heptose 6-epimerase
MRFLVTGVGGMIGANMALHLESLGHDVQGLDHFSTHGRKNIPVLKGQVHGGDIRDFDYGVVGSLDGIFHQAAITDTTVMDETLMRSVNVGAFVRLLDYAQRSGCPRVVYASSAATYGKSPAPNRENCPPAPANIYGISKVEMERAAQDFVEKNTSVSVVGLRYFNVYGPWEFHKGNAASMIYQLYQQIRSGKAPRVFKWGEQFRDFVYVKDVVEANMRAFQAQIPHSPVVVNVGTGLSTSFNQVIAILNKTLGASRRTEYFDNPYNFYQEATQADTRLAEAVIGFKAAYPPERGIPDYVEWLSTFLPAQSLR